MRCPSASAAQMAATHALSKMRADAEKASEFPHYEVGARKRNKIWIRTDEQYRGSMVSWAMPCLQTHIATIFPSRWIRCCTSYFSAHRVNGSCCKNQACAQAQNTAKVRYLTACSVVQWSWAALPSIKVNRVITGFTAHVKLFGHSVPNKNGTDLGIFSGHQEVLFSKSPDISQLFFYGQRKMFMWVEEKNRTGRLIPLPLTFKKAKKFFN